VYSYYCVRGPYPEIDEKGRIVAFADVSYVSLSLIPVDVCSKWRILCVTECIFGGG
jgi:hypothetical protein